MASLCPLGHKKDESDTPHYHGHCQCLDAHDWDRTDSCLTCGVARCEAVEPESDTAIRLRRAKGVIRQRCTRMRGHGNRHIYTVQRRYTGKHAGS